MAVPDGYLVVDKPSGWTSHDVVARCRTLLGTRRVGHGGTLDPAATGVLVLGVGRATRLLRYMSLLPKSYEGEVSLGVATSTLDAGGEVTERVDMSGVGLEEVRKAALSLTGRIEQVPPMVSAVKVKGRRLHELARQGVEVERPARQVDVYRFDVVGQAPDGSLRVEVECSSGTYVRVLAADLGRRLSGAAHLRSLRRTAVGSFKVSGAVEVGTVGPASVLPPAGLVGDLAAVTLPDELACEVAKGKFLDRGALGACGEGPWALLARDGRLLAVAEAAGLDRMRPAVVLAAPCPG